MLKKECYVKEARKILRGWLNITKHCIVNLIKIKRRTKMSKESKKSSVHEFVETIKSNPEEIIAWAKREIKEYEALIKILEEKKSNNNTRSQK